jgi:hypothetical protein
MGWLRKLHLGYSPQVLRGSKKVKEEAGDEKKLEPWNLVYLGFSRVLDLGHPSMGPNQ